MQQNNYTYGQGLFTSKDKLFLTPKKLSPAEYTISVKLDIEKNIYSGGESIIWQNDSQLPINRLCIDRGNIENKNLVFESINDASPDEYVIIQHNNLILIDLPKPLKTGERFTAKIAFTADLPHSYYHEDNIFEFNGWVAWYPKLYWDEPVGNSYVVTFEDTADGYEIFATGERNGNTYSEKNVANYYGFAVSKKMASISAEVQGVTVKVVYYPQYKECAEFILETAVDAIDFFIGFIGFYPYKSFTVLPGSSKWYGGGNFSSGIVYVHNFENYTPENCERAEYYRAIVPHEIGHQYFWEYVLENERPDWLGLGLSISLDREYSQFTKNIRSFHDRMINDYMEYVNNEKNTTIIISNEEAEKALSGNNNEYGDNYHGNVCHGKSFSVMSMLIDVIGKECYFSVMRHILKTYGGKVLYTPEFIRICEEFSGMNLKWFFDQWLKTNKNLSYSLKNITEKEADGIHTLTVDVCQKAFISAPVCVAAYFEDGTCQIKFTERLLNNQTLSFTSQSKYSKIMFDPFQVYAMKKAGKTIKDDCAELLIKNIKETSYTDAFDLSIGYYERYKKFKIDDNHIIYLLRMQLFDSRHYEECIKVCEDMIKNGVSRHDMADSYRWIGMCYDMSHEREKAVEAYKKALSFEEVQFGDRHDQYGIHVTREWIEKRIESPFVRK